MGIWNQAAEGELLDLLTDLIQIDTSNPPIGERAAGRERTACEYLSVLLEREGIPCRTAEKADRRTNLTAILKGDTNPSNPSKPSKPPILLLSHLDVVPGDGDWIYPPFSAHCVDGILYGRGTLDTKHLTAMELLAMFLLKREGIPLNRDIVLIASADEEAGSTCGMKYIAEEHPEWIPDGLTLSEGGGFVIEQGGKQFRTCTCGEKGEASGRVSINREDTRSRFDCLGSIGGAVLQTLARLSAFEPETTLCSVTEKMERVAGNARFENAALKNLWEYSTKDNLVLPAFDLTFEEQGQPVELPISYKFIPGKNQEEKEAELDQLFERLLQGLNSSCRMDSFEQGYESDVESDFIRLLEEKSKQFDPGVQILPMIALGRTDGRFVRKDVYGYSPLLGDLPFAEVLKKVHQKDECITLDSLLFGARVIYETLRELCIS